MVHRIGIVLLFVLFVLHVKSQEPSYDSLKSAIIQMNDRINSVELSLETSRNKFKSGILIATIGYTTTIAGGLMLGRSNDNLGQALLVAGGATGIIGTYKMVNAFNFLTGNRRKKR